MNDLYQVYLRTGRLAEGEAYFRRFVDAHPEQQDAPGYLAELRTKGAGAR